MDNEKKPRENPEQEKLESVGQMIVGGIEMVGGIITADGLTREEGDFNIEVGSEHQEVNKNLTAIDEAYEEKESE
jgi:hypothetical protein